jgi:chemotaxis protein methyltransferase CheR
MEEANDNDVGLFIKTMKDYTAYDFSNYSSSSLKRRLAKVMKELKMNMLQVADKIKTDYLFTEKIVKIITVNTTELFRDPEVWKGIKNQMISLCSGKDRINIWHAECSTGQEVYSMMILLNEANVLHKCSIYATDLNQNVLDEAKLGKYRFVFNKNYFENFTKVFNDNSDNNPNFKPVQHEKYLSIDAIKDQISIKPFLLDRVVYKKMDLAKDENPFDVIFDVIFCRNVIIYFNFELQNKVFNLFYRNLADKGCIVLGSHESIIGPYSALFKNQHEAFYIKT